MSNPEPTRVVLASGNPGKLGELQTLLDDLPIELLLQSQFHFAEAEETGLSFVENAILKARHACRETGLPAIADDSGLSVDALRGAPGIYSARFSGQKDDAANNCLLLEQLESVLDERRTARFHCALVYMRHGEDPCPVIAQASWEGRILFEPRGKNGFGYDPLFYVPDRECSSAELPSEVKNRISHRGQALAALLPQLQSLLR